MWGSESGTDWESGSRRVRCGARLRSREALLASAHAARSGRIRDKSRYAGCDRLATRLQTARRHRPHTSEEGSKTTASRSAGNRSSISSLMPVSPSHLNANHFARLGILTRRLGCSNVLKQLSTQACSIGPRRAKLADVCAGLPPVIRTSLCVSRGCQGRSVWS